MTCHCGLTQATSVSIENEGDQFAQSSVKSFSLATEFLSLLILMARSAGLEGVGVGVGVGVALGTLTVTMFEEAKCWIWFIAAT